MAISLSSLFGSKTAACDPQSISNNSANQWGQAHYTVYGNGVVAAGNATYPNQSIGLGQLGSQAAQQYYLPAPTGHKFSVGFMDANGNTQILVVDQAYLALMSHISSMHMGAKGSISAGLYQPAPAPHTKMLEGDFSIDEMEQAELIIAEIEGADSTCPEEIQNTTA